MPATPQERVLRARLAAHSRWARHDPVDGTAAARAAFLDRFDYEVDPERKLSLTERESRAVHARKAYFTRLALASARARKQKKSVNATNGRPDKTAAVNNDTGATSPDVQRSA